MNLPMAVHLSLSHPSHSPRPTRGGSNAIPLQVRRPAQQCPEGRYTTLWDAFTAVNRPRQANANPIARSPWTTVHTGRYRGRLIQHTRYQNRLPTRRMPALVSAYRTVALEFWNNGSLWSGTFFRGTACFLARTGRSDPHTKARQCWLGIP